VALRETLRPGVQGAPPAGRSRTAGRPWHRTLGGAHHAGDRGLWHGATQARRTLPALVEAEARPGQRRRSMMGRHRSADKTSEESDRGETAHGGGRLARQHGIRDSESKTGSARSPMPPESSLRRARHAGFALRDHLWSRLTA